MRITKYIMLGLVAGLMACGEPSEEEIQGDPEEIDTDGKYEAWDSENNPSKVDNSYAYEVASLPLKGEAKMKPWSGDYWATARDGLNIRWDGDSSLSPAEKVAKAFNLPEFPKWYTNNVGIYSPSLGAKACDDSSECKSDMGSASCVRPRGVSGSKTGRCIPGWYGICHGWAPAAITEPQAIKEVTKNGVTFYPGDLEGLASFVYQDNLDSFFLSRRCYDPSDKLGRDNNGCVREGECRDMNPGSFFIVVTNMLGLRGVGVVEDKTADYQVWNQPVRAFRVTNGQDGKLKEITNAEASKLLNVTDYKYNNNAVKFFYVELELDYISESSPAKTPHNPDDYTSTDHYQFILEVDSNGRVIGGEWVGSSMNNHPDFMWWPKGKPIGTQGGLSFDMVADLMKQASGGGGGGGGATTTTLLDNGKIAKVSKYLTIGVPDKAKLEVKMTGSGNADLYVRLGMRPTLTKSGCKSTNADSNETCTLTAPAAGGTYSIRVYPRVSSSTVTVTATVTPAQ